MSKVWNSDEEFRQLVRAFELSQGQDLGAWERLYGFAEHDNLVNQLPTPPWAPRMTTEAIERVFQYAYTHGRHTRVEATYKPDLFELFGSVKEWPGRAGDTNGVYVTTRFYVGRSGGTSPVFLKIHNTRSAGGTVLDPHHFVHARLLTPERRRGSTVRWNPNRVANTGLDEEVRRLERTALAGLDAGDLDSVTPWLAALQRLGRLDERVDLEDWARDLTNLVKDWISEEIDRSAAQAWSQNEDEDQWTIATFGDATAVNGELVDPDLPLGHEVSPEGYVHTNLGGQIPAVEDYANLEHAVGFVADDVKLPEEVVWAALKEAWDAVWGGYGSFARAERNYWEVSGSTSGESDVYVTPERTVEYFEASSIDLETAMGEQFERLVNRVISRIGGHIEADRDVVRAAVERLWREQPHLDDWHFIQEARRALWPEEYDPGEPDDEEGAGEPDDGEDV